ncbi:MAG: hypothetical protein J0L97_09440, partial [Alphaproteobacteria bacterium]|nr:hypothetical protein [Alphaproteobacteria bacterium]
MPSFFDKLDPNSPFATSVGDAENAAPKPPAPQAATPAAEPTAPAKGGGMFGRKSAKSPSSASPVPAEDDGMSLRAPRAARP